MMMMVITKVTIIIIIKVHETVDGKHHIIYLPLAWAQAAVRR